MTVTALPAAIKMPMSVRGRSRERLGIEGMANHARDHHHRHVAASLLAWPLEHAGGWRRVNDDWLCIGGACSCGLGFVVGTARMVAMAAQSATR